MLSMRRDRLYDYSSRIQMRWFPGARVSFPHKLFLEVSSFRGSVWDHEEQQNIWLTLGWKAAYGEKKHIAQCVCDMRISWGFKWGVLEQRRKDRSLGGGSLLQKYSQTCRIYWQTNTHNHLVLALEKQFLSLSRTHIHTCIRSRKDEGWSLVRQ